jgi:hypothetical protein
MKGVNFPYPPTRHGDALLESLRVGPMLALHGEVTEEGRSAERSIDKNDVKQTFTIGPTVSMTCLITPTALFHVFKISIASAAQSRARDISIWLSVTAPTEEPASMGRSPVWDERDRRLVTSVDCMVSFWALTTTVVEELAFADTAIINERVVGSAECVQCSSALLRTISSSKRRTLSQMKRKNSNR